MDFKHVKENEEKSVLEKKEKVNQDFWRQKYHLQGIVGLINDPNGFSQFKGKYHLFYQWNPLKTDHTAKYWGHSVSDDLLHWERKSTALRPDTWYSKNGAYSGSGIVINEKLYLFYTGNVKDEEGNRSSYQCFAISEDGENFERLEPSIVNQPDGYTRHIRDPKIWEKDGKYYAVIGIQSEKLEGKAVLYSSENVKDWKYLGEIAGGNKEPLRDFGYMWECPNLCRLGGYEFLAVCPQGLPSKTFRWHNMWQAGYFPLPQGEKIIDATAVNVDSFTEWDCGFDFYAPQIFEDGRGRTISIGWMGTFDASYTSAPEGMDRCHVMTLPREIYADKKGTLHQVPVRELKERRKAALPLQNDTTLELDELLADIELTDIRTTAGRLMLNEVLAISFEHGTFGIHFADTAAGKEAAAGRSERFIRLETLRNIRIVVDASCVEVYANDGMEVFSTRWFPVENKLRIRSNFDVSSASVYPLEP